MKEAKLEIDGGLIDFASLQQDNGTGVCVSK
jgi:hypothetical protein